MLEDTVQKCLQVCDQKEIISIAFPALGAGNLNYPGNVVAKVMITTVQNYYQLNTTTCIQAVKFVIFMADTYKEFQRFLLSGDQGGATSVFETDMPTFSPSLPAPVYQPTPSSLMSLPAPVYQPTPSSLMSLPASPQSGSSSELFQTGNITVEILCGDITDDDSDVIVNTTLSDLQLASGAVSRAISDKAGPVMQQECQTYIKQYKQLEEGKVCVTQATGQLKCKKVFHVIVPNKKKATSLNLTVTTCLKEAEVNKLRSIAIPAIGTGGLSFKSDVVAQGMCQAIIEFGATQPVYLHQVRMVIFQTDMHEVFTQKFKELSNVQVGQPQPSLLHRFGNYVSSTVGNYFSNGKQYPDSRDNTLTGPKVSHTSLSPSYTSTTAHPVSFTNIPDSPSQFVQIRIYAKDHEAVTETEEKLLGVINQNFVLISIDDDRISSLKPNHVMPLTQKANEHHVNIEVDIEFSRIQLRGSKNEVQIVKTEIERVLHQLDTEKLISEHSATTANLLHKNVTWQYLIGNKYEDYDAKLNYEIEQAYQLYIQHKGSATFYFWEDKEQCQITFNTKPMQEKAVASGLSTSVKRITIEDKIKDMLEKGYYMCIGSNQKLSVCVYKHVCMCVCVCVLNYNTAARGLTDIYARLPRVCSARGKVHII